MPGFPEGSGVRPGTPALLSSRFGGEANLLGGVIDRNLGLIFSPPAPGRYVVRYATGGGWRASEFAVEKREFHADGDSYKITEVRVGR